MQADAVGQYSRMAAGAVVGLILVWTLLRRRDFRFHRFHGLVRWSVAITIAAVLVSDIAAGETLGSPHLLFHCAVFVAALGVMAASYVKGRAAGENSLKRPGAQDNAGRGLYAAWVIGFSLAWVVYAHLRPTLSPQVASEVREYGWAVMGAIWGIVVSGRFVEIGVQRPKLMALGFGLLVFVACSILARAGDFGRLVAPGLFLLMQVPVLMMEPKVGRRQELER